LYLYFIKSEDSMIRVNHRRPLGRLLGAVVCAAALSACATAPQASVAPPKKPSVEEMLAKANQASSAGQKEQAVTLWKETATAYPADKTPWSNIAQTRYDAGQYGEAIVNAQEVLVRDPNDKLANSIIAISGLRLSTRALADLSRQNNLSGSLRTESQDLAKLLRESLGETVLVPPATPPAAPVRATAAKAKKSKGKVADDDSSANPFGALK
jgi:tetratricopeptide (TPR) repeat protein